LSGPGRWQGRKEGEEEGEGRRGRKEGKGNGTEGTYIPGWISETLIRGNSISSFRRE
jgi:hypothetical protein